MTEPKQELPEDRSLTEGERIESLLYHMRETGESTPETVKAVGGALLKIFRDLTTARYIDKSLAMHWHNGMKRP